MICVWNQEKKFHSACYNGPGVTSQASSRSKKQVMNSWKRIKNGLIALVGVFFCCLLFIIVNIGNGVLVSCGWGAQASLVSTCHAHFHDLDLSPSVWWSSSHLLSLSSRSIRPGMWTKSSSSSLPSFSTAENKFRLTNDLKLCDDPASWISHF